MAGRSYVELTLALVLWGGAICLGIAILGESLTAPVLAGAVLVMAGLYLVNRPSRKGRARTDG